MDFLTAQGFVNDIVYGIDGTPDPRAGEFLSRCVDFMIDKVYFTGSVQEYAEAIDVTLREGSIIPAVLANTRRFTEVDLLDVLRLLKQHLDDRRPWPAPAFVKLDPAQWSDFGGGRAIARIDRPIHQITAILGNRFDQVGVGPAAMPVMILKLRSGDVVAITGSVDPRSARFLLLQRDGGDPAMLIERFVESTRFKPEEVIPIHDADGVA